MQCGTRNRAERGVVGKAHGHYCCMNKPRKCFALFRRLLLGRELWERISARINLGYDHWPKPGFWLHPRCGFGDEQLNSRIAAGMETVEDLLRSELSQGAEFITDKVMHLTTAGGKRFRQ